MTLSKQSFHVPGRTLIVVPKYTSIYAALSIAYQRAHSM
jgi:hypothetical protein